MTRYAREFLNFTEASIPIPELLGVVSAIQLIKDPAYLCSPVVSKFINVTHKLLPIIVLGLLRVILVKGTYYSVIYSVRVSFLLHTY